MSTAQQQRSLRVQRVYRIRPVRLLLLLLATSAATSMLLLYHWMVKEGYLVADNWFVNTFIRRAPPVFGKVRHCTAVFEDSLVPYVVTQAKYWKPTTSYGTKYESIPGNLYHPFLEKHHHSSNLKYSGTRANLVKGGTIANNVDDILKTQKYRDAGKLRVEQISSITANLASVATTHSRSTFPATDAMYYLYDHSHEERCCVHYLSWKYAVLCGRDAYRSRTLTRPLLIVAVQRSGTHFMWETLQQLGIDVHHEGVGPEGAVSWLYSVNAHRFDPFPPESYKKLWKAETRVTPPHLAPGQHVHYPLPKAFAQAYIIDNPKPLNPNLERQTRFRRIFHQVRHPLRVISTLMRCCSEYDRFWKWIAHVQGFKTIQRYPDNPLRRAMLLYLLWNKHIEMYADIRYRAETTSAYQVCLWAGFGNERCNSNHKRTPSYSSISTNSSYNSSSDERSKFTASRYSFGNSNNLSNIHDSFKYEMPKDGAYGKYDKKGDGAVTNRTEPPAGMRTTLITWKELDTEDLTLSNLLKIMCYEYDYELDPHVLPQPSHTYQYHA